MKHNKIFSSEVVHKGKTLDRVLGGGNNNNSSANCYLLNFDYENPPITLGNSVSDLFNTVMLDNDVPIQFVYSDNYDMYISGLCDIIYPYNPETKEVKCESIFKFRQYTLNSVFRDESTLTVCANLTVIVDDIVDDFDLCYKSYPVERVHVDVDKKTVTYLEIVEGQPINVSAVFSFLVPENINSRGRYEYGSPKAVEVINSGTQLKVYLNSTIEEKDYAIINISSQSE